MSFFSLDQATAAYRANVETLLGLSTKVFESVEQLVKLNVQAVKSTLEDNASHTQQALSVRAPQELATLQVGAVRQAAEEMLAYSRHLFEIASSTRLAVDNVSETHLSESFRQVHAWIDSVCAHAPAGSEAVAAMVKSALDAASSAHERVQTAARQALEMTVEQTAVMAHEATEARRAAKKAEA
ncbi:granule protein PhaP [Pandoraea terrae]|uniref:Granule protein PhaP n=1 Tax=Pandoraea terrae TaxID=1537710 RepID=A0A5E4X8C6_9BURK|nr:TIGR01841 family phasin [Pandoraea terrae]VVE32526.1 granule protein PhaP [Pandoraea terrae]